MAGIRIWWDNDLGAYRIVTPFKREFIDLLKGLIPASDRSWNDSSKTWAVSERYLEPTKALVEKIFGQKAAVITRAESQTASAPPSITMKPMDKVILDFVRLVPFEAMQKAYRMAAITLHPDHGGDMDKMSALNAAWQRMEKEIYGR